MGSKGSATTKQSYSLPPEFQAAYKKSIDMATAATSQPYQAYQGQLVAGLNPTQLQGISNVNAAQGMALPAIGRGMQLTERAAQGITPELYNQFYSPYTRDVADTTFANMMESAAQQRSGLKGGAIQAGAFGGDRAGIAAAEMARQQQLGLGQTMSGIYNQGYGQAMQLAGQQAQNYGAMGQQLAGLGVGAQGSVLQGAQAQLAAGAQQQATDQAQLQAAYEQWMQRQSYPYQQAQFFANIAQGLGSGAGGTSTTSTPGPSWGSQALGALGAIGSIASLSDERMKENIEAVGTLNDGQTIYRYNFKGDPKTQIGLLAQEVEEHKPGAVTEAKGLKMVNYKDATDQSASMGGLVTPDMQRQNFADGGVPYHPYESRGYVPEGKIGSGGVGIPKAPAPFEDEGLSKDWKEMMPLTKEQVGGLKALADKLGISLDRPEKSALGLIGSSEYDVNAPKFEDEYPTYSPRFASGGVVGRNGYFMGGEPTMEDAMNEAGLAAAEEPEAPSRLLQRESGGDFGAKNAQGYVGRAQFGPARLEEAKQAGVVPAEMDAEGFRMNPDVQKEAEAWHFGDINNFIDKSGLAAFEGETINGIPVTREGMVNVAHLGGKGGLQKFISSGGRYNPSDANGTSLSDYLAMGASQSGVAGATVQPMADTEAVMPEEPRSRFDLKKLIASEENPSIIESIMGRRLSPEARAAVMNASFAMLAGRSPFMGVNIGEAGKVGMQTYYNALQQQRELAKQQADIGRQGYEAQTGRMTAETAQLNAARQLYAQMLPQIRFWAAKNPGKPLPLEFQRVIDAAYPPVGPAGVVRAPGLPPQISSNAPATGATTPGAPATGEPSATEGAASAATEGAPEEMPAPPEGQASTGNPELDSLYSQLPKELNPNHWTQIAENAQTIEYYLDASRTAIDLTKQYQSEGIPLPSGTVMFPGQEQKLRTEKAIGLDVENVNKFDSSISDIQSSLSSRKMISEGLRESLSKAETGKFASIKADLISALNTFGLATPDQLAEAADVQTAMKYFAQSVLDSGMKDKIGPQISNADLQLVATGTGSVENIAAANRRIVGAVYGKLMHDQKKAEEWNKFVIERGGIDKIKSVDVRQWQDNFGKTYKLSDYVQEGIKNTPVKGEVGPDTPLENLRVGYKYVMPDGSTKVYTGIEEDGFFTEVE